MVYETLPVPLDFATCERVARADVITFASASAARYLAQSLGELQPAPSARLVAIGTQTAAAVRRAFGRIDAEAVEPSLPALVAAVLGAVP